MSRDANSWSSEHKKNLVLDIIRGETTLEAASSTHGLPASQIEHWIDIGMTGLENALKTDSPNTQAVGYDQPEDEQSPIGRDPSLIYRSADEINAKISKLYEDLGHSFILTIPYERLRKNVMGWLDNGKIADEILADNLWGYYNIIPTQQKTVEHYISTITLAILYSQESIKLLEKGDIVESLKSLEKAKEYCEEAEENSLSNYKDNTKTENAREGGKKRSERMYLPLKKAVDNFLRQNCPPDGWKNMREAASAIENAVNALQEESASSSNEGSEAENGLQRIRKTLSPDNMHNTLYNWISKDEKLRFTFEKTRKSKEPSHSSRRLG